MINDELAKRQWTNEFAAKKLYKKYKKDFDKRKLGPLKTVRFNNVKLGNDQSQWIRDLFAEFFGVKESDIPRKIFNRLAYRNGALSLEEGRYI